jgi:hypothetical protein
LRGPERYCDIAHIIEPSKRLNFGEEEAPPSSLSSSDVALSFDLIRKPLTRGHVVGPGSYCLEIEFTAENAAAFKRSLRIEIDGRWSEDESRILGGLAKMWFEG